MIVTFISECEKKALSKTRHILDSFAIRVGNRTWQTAITEDGIKFVKKLLNRTASKNTAVSCHRVRGNKRSELIWIIGNRNKFNLTGAVPVSTTQKPIINTGWESDWHYLPLIKSITALAALFHDWGKSSICFQNKLKSVEKGKRLSDPVRHEWISCLFLKAFVANESDKNWLTRLSAGEVDEKSLQSLIGNNKDELGDNLFVGLPEAASLIMWLILTHHKLPKDYSQDWRANETDNLSATLQYIARSWGYENITEGSQYEKKLNQCYEFDSTTAPLNQTLLSESALWLKQVKKWATKLYACLPLIEKSINDNSCRLVLHYARLSLMLGDHYYSSLTNDKEIQSEMKLYANTHPNSGILKQKLDQHLVGVAKNALSLTHLLPLFENELPVAQDIKYLKKKSENAFKWQDKAVEVVKNWQVSLKESTASDKQGFFAVNIASTGCGKTIANAKIMYALSKEQNSLRYTLALGLRTLTLQTGDEYRNRIGLDTTELAVLIGSKEVTELHYLNKDDDRKIDENEESAENEYSGSESIESLLDEEIDYDFNIPQDKLSTVLKSKREQKFLHAPVLVCTIDHLMAATETTRGGRYILPSLRLMSSDLVIDEIDDFDSNDLIAIGRLIHLAGMLGRKIMISSATIPPDLAQAYFNSYQEGWQIFCKTRNADSRINCMWVDEFTTKIEVVTSINTNEALNNYSEFHREFISKRVKKLQNIDITPVKRKGEIINCDITQSKTQIADVNKDEQFYENIRKTIEKKHNEHHIIDPKTHKKISFGVVRVANIDPCIKLTRYLLNAEWSKNIDVKVQAYHARQVLLLRNIQEKHLDEVLKRKDENKNLSNNVIRSHIDNSLDENIIFILVATPVEEVGRDHDFDWAIIEPSSFRSIIQLAGRVLRHRDKLLSPEPNVAIMQYNLKAFRNDGNPAKKVYIRPGYEENDNSLNSHDLFELLKDTEIEKSIDAVARISRKENLNSKERFVDLEHHVISKLSNTSLHGPESMQGWLTQFWWLTALAQKYTPFRASEPTTKLYLIWCDNDEKSYFAMKCKQGYWHKQDKIFNIVHQTPIIEYQNRFWLPKNYENLLLEYSTRLGISEKCVSSRYGEININKGPPGQNCSYIYSDQFGLEYNNE